MNIKGLTECPQDSAMAPAYPLRRLWRAPWLVAFLRVLGMAWVYLVYFFPLASALATIEPPTELMTSEVTARSFMVNWTHTPGKVEKYRVVYYPTRGGKPEEVMWQPVWLLHPWRPHSGHETQMCVCIGHYLLQDCKWFEMDLYMTVLFPHLPKLWYPHLSSHRIVILRMDQLCTYNLVYFSSRN